LENQVQYGSVSTGLTIDGFSRKDYGNRNKEQLVPAVVVCAIREHKQGTLMGLVAPANSPEAKTSDTAKKLRCRSALESVFPGILDQIFCGFIDSTKLFSDAEVSKI